MESIMGKIPKRYYVKKKKKNKNNFSRGLPRLNPTLKGPKFNSSSQQKKLKQV